MKYLNINFRPLQALVVGSILVLTISSCDTEDKNEIEYTPGETLAISGASSAYIGDTEEYLLVSNIKDTDYTWSIDAGASITENPDNDAYVDVNFSDDGSYVLSVSNGNADGEKSISVLARQVSFDSDSIFRMETINNDTIAIQLQIGGGFRGDFDYAYVITGDLTEGVDYEIAPGYESPITADADSLAEIRIIMLPEDDLDADTASLIVTINTVTPDLTGEYFLTDTLDKVIKYSIANDLKVASIDTTTLELSDGDEGQYEIPVSLSSPAQADVTVNYSVVGAGITDSSIDPGMLLFEKGESEKNIVLGLGTAAFTADQTITITLTGTTGSAEASVDGDVDTKEIVIDIE